MARSHIRLFFAYSLILILDRDSCQGIRREGSGSVAGLTVNPSNSR